MTLTFGSVCSGIEAASVAWHPLGWRAAWLAEIEPFPSAVLAHHYPDTPNLGDMTTIARRVLAGEVDAPDVFTGGTPCQAFSVAGLRKSLDDDRGNLSLKFVELADAIDHVRGRAGQPAAVIVWENVPGVLSTKDNAFGCFLAGLAGEDGELQPPGRRWEDAGAVYGPRRAVAWRTLDAQYFGLAQRRRRAFVVASAREDLDPAAVLFEWEGLRRDTAPRRGAGEGATGSAAAGAGVCGPLTAAHGPNGHGGSGSATDKGAEAGHIIAANAEGSTGLPFLTTSNIGKHVNNQTPLIATTHALRAHTFDARQTDVIQYGDVSGPLDTHGHTVGALAFAENSRAEVRPEGGDGQIAGSLKSGGEKAGQSFPVVALSSKDHGADASADLAPTLRAMGHAGSHANGGGQMAAQTAMQVRRLTPRECERLQGFPDDYTLIPWRGKPAEDCPDGPRYKALGNSWAVPCARWIGARIDAALHK